MLERTLDLELPQRESVFIWGARKTGKSTYLKMKYPDALWIDLLKGETFLRYNKEPYLLRQEILAHTFKDDITPIIIDEIQKVPSLLDEIHWLMENMPQKRSFILCGSSLRRLKHEGANLLGGRAWRQIFVPLCYPEIPSFDLLRILNHGLVPSHFLSNTYPKRALDGYLSDYLIPEIQWESRIRQLGAFSRFLEAMAFSNGQVLNASNIAREAGVSAKTVGSYIDLLVDMLIGHLIFPFAKSQSRQLIVSHPKFYFFDTGVTQAIKGHAPFQNLKGPEVGHAFENYVLLELIAYRALSHKNIDIQYWRTKSGMEIDFVLARGKVILEAKISSPISKRDISALVAFAKENDPKRVLIVCLEPNKRLMQEDGITIEIMPIELFLKALWKGDII